MIEQWNKEVQDGVIETFVAQFQLRSFPIQNPLLHNFLLSRKFTLLLNPLLWRPDVVDLGRPRV